MEKIKEMVDTINFDVKDQEKWWRRSATTMGKINYEGEDQEYCGTINHVGEDQDNGGHDQPRSRKW